MYIMSLREQGYDNDLNETTADVGGLMARTRTCGTGGTIQFWYPLK